MKRVVIHAGLGLVALVCPPLSRAPAQTAGGLAESAELAPAQAHSGDFVGWSVAASGDSIVVGAWTSPGAAYVYVRNGAQWDLQAELAPTGATYPYGFGTRVAIDGDTLVCGAPMEDLGGGALYVFERSGAVWDAGQRITIAGSPGLGSAVAIEGDRLAVGAYGDSGSHGAVFVLSRGPTGWVVDQKLSAAVAYGAEYLGSSLALQGDSLLAGAPGAMYGAARAGRACLFSFDGTSWSETATIAPSDPLDDRQFGDCVALDGEHLVVGAPASNAPPTGSVYAFTRVNGVWLQEAKLTSVEGDIDDRFGSALALRGDQLVVGAHIAQGGTGAAYVFERHFGYWSYSWRLAPNGLDPASRFGLSVAASAQDVVVGAPYGTPAGSAFVFDVAPSPTFHYCSSVPNSSGLPCSLESSGSVSLANDDFVLLANGCPPLANGLFFCGSNHAQIPLANGFLCVSPFTPGIFRLPPAVQAGGNGSVARALEFGALPPGCVITPGSTWYFQLWFRDGGPGHTNMSDGLGVTFAP